jgi:plasmid stabilization system protein ParE
MAHRVSPQAEADLDGVWYYVAKESGSIETANHLIDSITDRFFLLSRHPHLGRSRAMKIWGLAFGLFQWESI